MDKNNAFYTLMACDVKVVRMLNIFRALKSYTLFMFSMEITIYKQPSHTIKWDKNQAFIALFKPLCRETAQTTARFSCCDKN